MEQRIKDKDMWQMGLYVEQAVLVAIDHALGGKKAKSEYAKEPLFNKAYEDSLLTEEEKQQRELEKWLSYEKAWQVRDEMKGLPKPMISATEP